MPIFHIVAAQTISKTRNIMLKIVKYRGKLKKSGALRAPYNVITKVSFNFPSSFRHIFNLPFAFQHIFNLPSTLPSSFQYARFIGCTILGCYTKTVFNLPILLQSYFQFTVRISIYQPHPMIKIMCWGMGN